MNGNIRVGNLFGIPLYVNPSWFLVLGLVTLTYSNILAAQFPDLGGGLSWGLGLLTALLMFASVLAHELGHSFVALSQRIRVHSITLFLFGGLANLDRESATPGQAFQVAIAGPAVSAILFGIATFLQLKIGTFSPLSAILGLLASINFALALFNLLPGLPLDGGNILKALVWKLTNNPYRGIEFAGRLGQLLGWAAIAIGLIPLFAFGSFGNIWYVSIGWFLLRNARFAAQNARLQNALSKLTAADAVLLDSPIVNEELSLREFANNYTIGKRNWQRYLVTDNSGQLIGTLAIDDLKAIPTGDWPRVRVKALVKSYGDRPTAIAEQSLLDVVQLLEQNQVSEIPVLRDGVPIGLLEKSSIVELLAKDKSEAMLETV